MRRTSRWRQAVKVYLAAAVLLQAAGFGVWTPEGGAQGGAPDASGSAGLFADQDTPVVITADSMELQRKTGTVIYTGNVLAVQDDVRITSDTLRARYDAEGGELRSVVAEGGVRIRHGGREMTGDKAVFDGRESTITVSGNTTLRAGNSSVSGDRITIYVREDRGVVENSRGRVRAVIFPEQLNR